MYICFLTFGKLEIVRLPDIGLMTLDHTIKDEK
jgi:hypothetical protein